MLNSLPCGAMVVGDGVTAVTFRLQALVMDQNYVKKDSGERKSRCSFLSDQDSVDTGIGKTLFRKGVVDDLQCPTSDRNT